MDLPTNQIICGDCLDIMKDMPAESIDCCVTSPPYWGLRDYGCDGQIGLEQTPEEFVRSMVAVFAEVNRVLKPDGSLWLNLGDSYAASSKGSGGRSESEKQESNAGSRYGPYKFDLNACGLKPKDLVGIPWRVAFALQEYGWYLRQDIIWHKPNPMPESVRDRCTKAHEYIFLLTKSARYYYDAEAVKEDSIDKESYTGRRERNAPEIYHHDMKNCKSAGSVGEDGKLKSGQIYPKRNKRSVWTVTTKSLKEAHFAAYPEDLIEPCILAGCPKDGIVLDPFMGAGTTAVVARKNGRNYIGCELNPEYKAIAEIRINAVETCVPVAEQRSGQKPLFNQLGE